MNRIERLGFDLDDGRLTVRLAMTRRMQMTDAIVSPGGRTEGSVRFPVQECAEPGYDHQFVVDLGELALKRDPDVHRYTVSVENVGAHGAPVVRRVGRAAVTDRPVRPLVTRVDDLSARVEVGPGGNLLIHLAEDLPLPAASVHWTGMRSGQRSLSLRAHLTGDLDTASVEVAFTDRQTGAEARAPMQVQDLPDRMRSDHGHLHRDLAATVDLVQVTGRLPRDTEYVAVDLVVTDAAGVEGRLAPVVPDELDVRRLQPVSVSGTDRVSHYVPYVTFKAARIGFKVDHFEPAAFRSLKRSVLWAPLAPVARRFAGAWLVGELPHRAQDNGYHLFRWIRERHPGRRVYYVITADSPDRERLEALGNVVVRGSREHVRLSLLATRLISTHLPEYLLPTPDPRLVRRNRAVRVFLQHGIMGMKNMVPNYGRRSSTFRCDVFHVSSAREREMIINDFGYLPSQVRVTGLPRFDRLLEPSNAPRGILVIPTWRDWLLRPEAFEGSEFLERWRGLLHDERVRQLVAAGERITFVLHPNLAHHTDLLDVPEGVTVLRQGERDVQDLMRDHRALVTDYSSVGFDFALLGRPVYYFQFDRDRFLGRYPSHIDPVTDLPGHVATTSDEVLDAVVAGWQAGFPMPEENARRIRMWVDHPDRDNCSRVYESIRKVGRVRVLANRVRSSRHARRLYQRFSASRAYRPAMRQLMALARLTPRSRTVVFESGNGRQYAGSPRAIYEELARRDTGLRTVWSTTSTFRPLDNGTRKVAPRSPRFYWELGRAKFWVTDQNLGVDVRPGRRTFYLQTWHGTPLKRMQHDALTQEGRRPGYLERVTRQTGYWTALLSPSPYASECFRSAFRFTGEMLELGCPRNDVLAGPGLAERAALTRARLGLPSSARVVLFAPTFRDDARQGSRYVFDPRLDYRQVAEDLPEDMVLLVRAHHVTGGSAGVPPDLRGRVLDVTAYEDSHDLLAAADALVTDYSSVMFDYALTRRPMLFYCPDLEEYATQLRGLYLDLTEVAPGPIVRSQEELVGALRRLDETAAEHADRRTSFVQQFAPLDDGAASARVVDVLLQRR